MRAIHAGQLLRTGSCREPAVAAVASFCGRSRPSSDCGASGSSSVRFITTRPGQPLRLVCGSEQCEAGVFVCAVCCGGGDDIAATRGDAIQPRDGFTGVASISSVHFA